MFNADRGCDLTVTAKIRSSEESSESICQHHWESIFIKTERQSIYIMCEESFDMWQRDLTNEDGT